MGRGSHPQKMKLTLCACKHAQSERHTYYQYSATSECRMASHCVLCRVGILISEVKNISVLFDFDAEGSEGPFWSFHCRAFLATGVQYALQFMKPDTPRTALHA